MASAKDFFRDNAQIRVMVDLPGWVHLTLSPAFEAKALVVQFLRFHLDRLPEDLAEALILAVDELISNAIEHGCRLDPELCVDFAFIRASRMILIYVQDQGNGFSMGDLVHAAVNNPPDNPLRHTELRSQMGLRPGGFGIMLARQVADDLLYNENGNTVLLIKYLDAINGPAAS